MDEVQKHKREQHRNKYLRTDKSKKCKKNGCSCERCNLQLSKKIYKEQYLKKLTIELNKYPICEFI